MEKIDLKNLSSDDETLKALGIALLKSLNGSISIIVKKNDSELTFLNPEDILNSISIDDLIRALLNAHWSDPDIEDFLHELDNFFYDREHTSS